MLAKYPFTTSISILVAIIIAFYLYYRYTQYGRVVYYENKLSFTFRRHRTAVIAIIILLVIAFLSYRIESDIQDNKQMVVEYTRIVNYLREVINRGTPPNVSDGENYKNVKRLQYLTDNYSLRYAIQGEQWEIAIEILDKILQNKISNFDTLKKELCRGGEFACGVVGGKPFYSFIKFIQGQGKK